jgi:nucleoid-associated protein YgaU
MEKNIKKLLKSLKINENLISSVLGGVVVILMGVMIFNYFKSVNRTGTLTEEAAVKVEEVNGTEGGVYEVKKDDELYKIAEKIYGDGKKYVEIANENGIANPDLIEVGMKLKLPDVEKVQVEVAKTNESSSYTVVVGDHLWKIAVAQYGDGYAWVKIYDANKKLIGRNPNEIEKGMVLALPR